MYMDLSNSLWSNVCESEGDDFLFYEFLSFYRAEVTSLYSYFGVVNFDFL